MKKPIIGIVGRCGITMSGKDIMEVFEGYRKSVIISGGIPITILPTQNEDYTFDREKTLKSLNEEEKEDLIAQIKLCNGIIIPGGCRIFEYDKFICKYALDNNIPLLGICLGMQTMASVDCLNKKAIDIINNGVDHRKEDKFVHNVEIKKESLLYNIVGNNKFRVNSFHKCNVIDTNRFDIVRLFR